MTIKQSIARISNSTNTLIVISAITTVASVVAAKCKKPNTAVTLLAFSTTVQAREIYVRHQGNAQVLRKIRTTTNAISEMDVPAHIVAAMKANEV